MATCGYVCPLCGGRGLTDEGKLCGWCEEKNEAPILKGDNHVNQDSETQKEEPGNNSPGISVSVLTILLVCSVFSVLNVSAQTLTSKVNPFIGTGGHGHTFPGAVVPFGMVALSPDTRVDGSWDGCSGYHYSDSLIYGFSHTHLSGTGCSDLGDIMLMPVSQITTDRNVYSSAFSHQNESAKAGYYRVLLQDDQIDVELTASARAGFHHYTFPSENSSRMVVLDLNHRDELLSGEIEVISNTTVRGYRRSKAWAIDQWCFYDIKFSEPFDYIIDQDGKKIIPSGESIWSGKKVAACFVFKNGKELKVKVGISGTDKEGASKNLVAEIPHWDFQKIYIQADSFWNVQLNKIIISNGTPDQQTIFYTALYHCMIHPSINSDVDHRYRGRDGKIHIANGFDYYTVFSLWDTYRALHPLFTIIEKERTVDFIKTFLAQYDQVGRLPIWELWGNETDCMIGYHVASVITDAYIKGIRGFDAEKAFTAMKSIANSNWRGLDIYRKKGYLEVDDEPESVSKTLEYAYDDWCIAQMAKALNHMKDEAYFSKRGENWVHLFDSKSGYIRPRKNGGWLEPFDPFEVNNYYTEANGWQYNFSIPQNRCIFLYNKWDSLFKVTNRTNGRDQADISGLIGQYAHGNEPSHHIAFLYSGYDSIDKTTPIVNYILENFYRNSPDGLIGNEDCGQMSAWYVLASLGHYQVCPGKNIFAKCQPYFAKNNFPALPENLDTGITIASNNPGPPLIIHSQGELFNDSMLVSITRADEGIMLQSRISAPVKIYYQSNLNPRKRAYDKPFYIHHTQEITTYSYKYSDSGKQWDTLTTKGYFYKIPNNWIIRISSTPHPQYMAGGPNSLIDGLNGKTEWRMGRWMGFQGQDFEATLDLKEAKKVSEFGGHFLQDMMPWIMMPQKVIFYTSLDGVNYTEAGEVLNQIPDSVSRVTVQNIIYYAPKAILARYIKIRAINYGKLPAWHISHGEAAYIFLDEVWVK